MKYTTAERNIIYKKILSDFDRVQASHNNAHLSFQVNTYFLTNKPQLDVDDFPEIVRHKPKNWTPQMYDGYWFEERAKVAAIAINRNIILEAIKETEEKQKEGVKQLIHIQDFYKWTIYKKIQMNSGKIVEVFLFSTEDTNESVDIKEIRNELKIQFSEQEYRVVESIKKHYTVK